MLAASLELRRLRALARTRQVCAGYVQYQTRKDGAATACAVSYVVRGAAFHGVRPGLCPRQITSALLGCVRHATGGDGPQGRPRDADSPETASFADALHSATVL